MGCGDCPQAYVLYVEKLVPCFQSTLTLCEKATAEIAQIASRSNTNRSVFTCSSLVVFATLTPYDVPQQRESVKSYRLPMAEHGVRAESFASIVLYCESARFDTAGAW